MLTIMALLGVLTARAAIRANYINYDNAMEYLVYAHMARGPKEALAQIEEISMRTTNGLALRVAYDDETTYPYWWYLRNYTNKDNFGKNPTRAQRDAVAILVGDANYGKIEPVVGQAYYAFEYTRIWWPNQDYFGLTWQRILDALSDPGMRNAIFQVWLNRDFTQYSLLTNQDMSLPNWQPSHKFRLYIRKDVLNSLWNYGATPTEAPVVADPYEGKGIKLAADRIVGTVGAEPGQFKRPRGIAVALDGSIYVADTENHRIQHLAADGSVLQVWGSFAASTETTPAGDGLFNEPWGIAVGPDGSVYVADTWNHRIQKFTSDGKFVKTWGFGISQTGDPFGFYGPRAVAVNAQGQVLVTDTGNKRVVVFDADGNYLTKFGEEGFGPGQFSEPVGLAVDAAGLVYVADTWNQRIQVLAPSVDGSYQPAKSWDIAGWYGQSLDNKPYIATDTTGHLFVADPEGYRILEFKTNGDFIQYWGDYGTEADAFDLPSAVSADPEGGVWVSDTNNGRIMHFTLPSP
jgi:DNA-binding beta-propeller fold protein YncE